MANGNEKKNDVSIANNIAKIRNTKSTEIMNMEKKFGVFICIDYDSEDCSMERNAVCVCICVFVCARGGINK